MREKEYIKQYMRVGMRGEKGEGKERGDRE